MEFIEEQKYKNEIGIYKIVNKINGMVYVGQTKEKFHRRFWLHQWKLRKGNHDNVHLQRAWNKYGEENFIFEIIEILPEEEIDEREKFWIDFYRKNTGCYSIQNGGQPENLNQYISDEARKAVGEKNRQRMIGTKLSEETRKKMSAARKGKFVKTKTQKITPEQAKIIKEMLIQGFTPKEIMNELNIGYKPINGIISANSWSYVIVEGWEEFRQNRKRGKGISSVGRKSKPSNRKISLDEAKIYYEKYMELHSLQKTADFFNTSIGIVRKRIDIYKQTLS